MRGKWVKGKWVREKSDMAVYQKCSTSGVSEVY